MVSFQFYYTTKEMQEKPKKKNTDRKRNIKRMKRSVPVSVMIALNKIVDFR